MEVILENQILDIAAGIENIFDVSVVNNSSTIINAGAVAFTDQNAVDAIAAHVANTNAHITSADRIAIDSINSKADITHTHTEIFPTTTDWANFDNVLFL